MSKLKCKVKEIKVVDEDKKGLVYILEVVSGLIITGPTTFVSKGYLLEIVDKHNLYEWLHLEDVCYLNPKHNTIMGAVTNGKN